MKKITHWLQKQGGAKELGWKLAGYFMLAVCTAFFSGSLALGKPNAAATFAAFCFLLAVGLGWHRSK